MIENLKVFLKDVNKLNECVEYALNFQSLPHDHEYSKYTAELLEIAGHIGEHLHNQLVKGIAIEEEIDKLAQAYKGMNDTEIFVAPWTQGFECSLPLASIIVSPSTN
jgi:hypothetical protein